MKLHDHFEDSTLTCRPIAENDIPFVVELVNTEYAYQDAYRNDTRTNKKHLSEMVAETEFYVFTDAEGIAGCVYVEFKESEIVYFGLLTIAKRLQGKGLGTKITKSIEQYARAQAKKELLLAYMHIAPWLRPYYESLGFQENGEVWDWDGIKLINMSKRLD